MHKQLIYDELKKVYDIGISTCHYLWDNPEVGGTEEKASSYIKNILIEQGFKIVEDERVPHAFYGEFGTSSPVLALLGEYDALPALSQAVTTEKTPLVPEGPGHGCGHNLLGSASLMAAITVKNLIEAGELNGTVRYYGCPEEELLVGKVRMIYYKMFEGCDLALSWHPMCANMVYDGAYLASAAMKFHFKGLSAHAAVAPERGRSALDAVELMNVGCNYLREHTIDYSRIHYTTDNYGYPPNIVPDKASAWYCVRAPHMGDVKDILRRIKLVAEGAAMMTETEVEFELLSGCSEMMPNKTFADMTYSNMLEADVPHYTEEEIEFAKGLQKNLNPEALKKDETLYDAEGNGMDQAVRPRDLWKSAPLTASSDTGDISFIMPLNLFSAACWPIGVNPHTWMATAANGHSIGEKGMIYASKVLLGCAYDIFTKPKLVEQIKKEFELNKTDYSPMYEEK